MRQCISYLQISRKPMIQLGGRSCTLSDKNPSVWNFLSPELEVAWRTVAIIIRVILLSPYLWIHGVSLSSILYNCYIPGASGWILCRVSQSLVDGFVGHLRNEFQVRLIEANCVCVCVCMCIYIVTVVDTEWLTRHRVKCWHCVSPIVT